MQDIYKDIVYGFIVRLNNYIIETGTLPETVAKCIGVDVNMLIDWLYDRSLPDGDSLGKIEDYLNNRGKHKIPVEKRYLIKKLDEYRLKNHLSYRDITKFIGLKSKSTLFYWLEGEKEPTEEYVKAIKTLLTVNNMLIEHCDIKSIIELLDNMKDETSFATLSEKVEKNIKKIANRLSVNKSTVYRWKDGKNKPNKHNKRIISTIIGYKQNQRIISRVTLWRWKLGTHKPTYRKFIQILKQLEEAGINPIVDD